MQRNTNMTQGGIVQGLIAFAIPLLLTSILQQVYSLADAVIVRRLIGVDAFAAIGADGTLLWICESMLIGLAQGFGVVFAQTYGASQDGKLRGSLKSGLLLAGGIGAAIAAVLFAASNLLLSLIHTPSGLRINALNYLRAMLPFIVSAALFNTAAAYLRATGDSRTPLAAMLISSLVNIALDIVLIALLPLGIVGAGLATSAAQLLAFFLCLQRIKRNMPVEDDRHGQTKLLIRMGLPSMLRNGVIALGGGIVQRLVNAYGIAMIAGYTASKKYFTLLQLCGSALEGSAATFVGQNTGAGARDRLRRGMRYIILLGILTSLLTGILAYTFAVTLIRFVLGSSDPAAVVCGIQALRWAAIFLPSLYCLCILRAFIQNMGYAMAAMGSGFSELVSRVIACAVLPAMIGETSVYIAEEVGWLLTLLYLCVCMAVIRKKGRRMSAR